MGELLATMQALGPSGLFLRLRGSGSKGARQEVIADARRRGTQLLAQLTRFEEKKIEGQKLLTMDAKELGKASGSAKELKRRGIAAFSHYVALHSAPAGTFFIGAFL